MHISLISCPIIYSKSQNIPSFLLYLPTYTTIIPSHPTHALIPFTSRYFGLYVQLTKSRLSLPLHDLQEPTRMRTSHSPNSRHSALFCFIYFIRSKSTPHFTNTASTHIISRPPPPPKPSPETPPGSHKHPPTPLISRRVALFTQSFRPGPNSSSGQSRQPANDIEARSVMLPHLPFCFPCARQTKEQKKNKGSK